MLKPSTNSSALSAESHTCAFCPNPSNYSCPKCQSLYCSLTCYKGEKHLFCSEKFYKNNVQEEHEFQNSKHMNPEKLEDRKKVLDIVDKYSVEDEQGWKYEIPKGVDIETVRKDVQGDAEWTKEEEKELNELLENVSPEDLWKVLSEEDKQRFMAFAKVNGVGE